jgi:hypothetical protein
VKTAPFGRRVRSDNSNRSSRASDLSSHELVLARYAKKIHHIRENIFEETVDMGELLRCGEEISPRRASVPHPNKRDLKRYVVPPSGRVLRCLVTRW